MRRFVWSILFFACCASAQDGVLSWFPLEIGNRWVYEHEVWGPSRDKATVTRWKTTEQIIGSVHVAEGTVILRQVNFEGQPDGSWLAGYGESHYLIRNSCLYFLNAREAWDEVQQQLRTQFRDNLLHGRISPNFCFPLEVGSKWGDSQAAFSWLVLRQGADAQLAPMPMGEKAFDIVSTQFSSGDTMHFWFEKGVGIIAKRDLHNGTYFDLRVRMLRFEPAATRKP